MAAITSSSIEQATCDEAWHLSRATAAVLADLVPLAVLLESGST